MEHKNKAIFLKGIFQAIKQAQAEGVKEPERIALKTIDAQTNWNKFKFKYNLK